ncbi:MAG TPA: 3-phosphoshikimate 1-carboxyvinyltransferase [Bacteroidales bacterium]|nr:3-phosphoshikimate 1-carboxyvinyltransferase [Bacteroidales bacterium]
MIVTVSPSEISGILTAPPSKSSMQRAVAASLMAEGESEILNPSLCDDARSAISMAECLGAEVTITDRSVRVKGGFYPKSTLLNSGESGLGVRIFSALSALGDIGFTLTGEGSLLSRPMNLVTDSLKKFGVEAHSKGGYLPLRIRGPLKGRKVTIDGSVSSQLLTGLLLALPVVNDDSRIEVTGLKSKPYIDLTISVLNDFGIKIENNNYREFMIGGNQKYKSSTYNVEGDWSGAAFILVMAAIAGNVTVKNLSLSSHQPDKMIIEILRMAGASVVEKDNEIRVGKGSLKPFMVDVSESPDLAPPLVALAANCNGVSIIEGTDRLRVKESNRGNTLQKEFTRIGVNIKNRGSSLEISGSQIKGGETVFSHNDHRIAMALATAALTAERAIKIEGAEAVSKSYPSFFIDLELLRKKTFKDKVT